MAHVDFPVPVARILIGRAVVARCDAHSDSQRTRGREQFVVCIDALLVSGKLRPAPTDRNCAGLSLRVVYRCADRVEKPFVTDVWREIHSELRFWRDRSRHFDVQHDFAVSGIRRGRVVARMIHRDGRNLWGSHVDFLEERLKVTAPIATSAFDDRDGLSGAIRVGREVVPCGEFRCRHAVLSTRPAMRRTLLPVRRPALWTCVEPEDTRHDLAQFFRQRDFALPAAVGSRSVMVDLHVGVKRRQQIAQLSLQHERALRRAAVNHGQVVLLSKVLHGVEVFLRGAVLLFQFLVRQVFPLGHRRAGEFVRIFGQRFGVSRRAHAHGHARDRGRVDRPCGPRIWQQNSLTSWQRYIDGHSESPD